MSKLEPWQRPYFKLEWQFCIFHFWAQIAIVALLTLMEEKDLLIYNLGGDPNA